jgi:hypothetical protein
MPEIALGIGRVQGELGGIRQEWLAWHDAAGTPYPLPQELIKHLENELEQERQRAEHMAQALEQARLENLRLLERLRQLGENDE